MIKPEKTQEKKKRKKARKGKAVIAAIKARQAIEPQADGLLSLKERARKKDRKLVLRPLTMNDYADVQEIMDLVYPTLGGAWKEDQLQAQIERFPEGQICVEDTGKVVAVALSMIVDYAKWGDKHTYKEITDYGYIKTHDPEGDTLYGVDIFVHPESRDLRLGRRLYDARKELCEKLNLRAIVAGGRIPGYAKFQDKLSPRQYIDLVKAKEIHDPVLSFQLKNDFHVRKVITNYEPDDVETGGAATLLEWINIYYEETEDQASNLAGQPVKEVIRVGTIQWQMRQVDSFDEIVKQVEYFVDTIAGYNADFAVFPEFFIAPLMAQFNKNDPSEAIRGLAEFSQPMLRELERLAVSYNINIIAGSMPEYVDLELRNVSYLVRRDGTSQAQYKLHVTPDEKDSWGLIGGDGVQVLETDVGKIGISICYDVEFPELGRLMADQGMKILFVPFWTDTKNGYLRVRTCAQARAIENECFVVITGSVGNLPDVHNMDIQYSQSAIFTPADFSFPHDAIAAQATPNTEMVLVADLDMTLLYELHEKGSVRNLKDRRGDLYRVSLVGE